MKRLEALRRVRHVLQGEDGTITLLKRNASTNALVDLLEIDTGWTYSDREANGGRLPPSVMFELQIAEEMISATDMAQIAAIRHGQQIFQIVVIAPGEPGIFKPSGLQRYWRFWLAPLEATA
jgi:hypothetical protein